MIEPSIVGEVIFQPYILTGKLDLKLILLKYQGDLVKLHLERLKTYCIFTIV